MHLTPFQKNVYQRCAEIPQGSVSSYAFIAHSLGCRAYRAVGNALNKNPFAPRVPCHRVVARDGLLGGFAHGIRKKIALLKKEGIRIRKNRIVDFDRVCHSFENMRTIR